MNEKEVIDACIAKVLVELCDEIYDAGSDGVLKDKDNRIVALVLTKEHIIEIINRKIKEHGGEA